MISSCLFCTASSCSLRPCSSSSSYLRRIFLHILIIFIFCICFMFCIFCSYSAYSHILLIFCIFWSSRSSYLDRNISDAGRASMPKFGIGAKISFSWYIHLVNVLSFCFSLSLRLSMVACMSR